ncbi:hypothetical protein [Bacillus sp. AK031]
MLDQKILKELKDYVREHLENVPLMDICESHYQVDSEIMESVKHSELDDFIKMNEKPSFREELFHFIDEKGLTDPEVYKRAGIDRKLFSKIRSNPAYKVGKNTAIALALALKLDTYDTEGLLNSAGFSLSGSDTYDLVIRFCLEKEIYDLDGVNQALDSLSLNPLTG